MHRNKQYSSFFQSFTHQTYKEIINKKHVNSKPKVLSNTMFSIKIFYCFGLRTFIVEQSDSLNNSASELFFLINLQFFLIYFWKHFDIYITYEENENSVKTTVANQCTWVRNHVSTFLSIVNKDLPVKNIVFSTNIHSLWKGTDFEGVILQKFIHLYEELILHKNSGSQIFTKWIGLSDFNYYCKVIHLSHIS